MKTISCTETHRVGSPVCTQRLLIGALLVAFASACGAVEERGTPPEDVGGIMQEMEDDNGMANNGLVFNGLAFNGLVFNGLAFNGLSSSAFASWFQQSPPLSNLFMKYLVRCSVPAGQTRTYSDGTFTYTWPGSLGLAPDWSSGAPATVAEQQVVTACMAALTNKYGCTVGVSVLGTTAQGQPIPYTSTELSDYSLREGCFYGNIFNGEGLFVGNDRAALPPSQSSFRACALTSNNACPPLVYAGGCQANCTLDATGTYYTQCTRNGITYRPITTRIRSQDVFTCGDGICQGTESCGNGNRADDCALDCGTCD